MNKLVDKILLEGAGSNPKKEFSFEDLNGDTVDAVIGPPNGQMSKNVVVGYQFNGSARHDENSRNPDPRNLFYILGRITKFITNYIQQYEPIQIIIQSDRETGEAAQKRINIYKALVEKNMNGSNYELKSGQNAHGYYLLLTRKSG